MHRPSCSKHYDCGRYLLSHLVVLPVERHEASESISGIDGAVFKLKCYGSQVIIQVKVRIQKSRLWRNLDMECPIGQEASNAEKAMCMVYICHERAPDLQFLRLVRGDGEGCSFTACKNGRDEMHIRLSGLRMSADAYFNTC